ncbi:hypothetical protein Tco_0038676 [Tanacetum coccineum]
MDLSDYEVPRVLVTCRRRQIDDENDDDENVHLIGPGIDSSAYSFLGGVYVILDGQPITDIDIANMIVDQSFAQLYDGDDVSLCCLGLLQLVILGNMPAAGLDTDDIGGSVGMGGLSSFQGHVNSSYFNMGTPPNFQTPMPSQPGYLTWPNLQTTIEMHHDVDGIFDQNILNREKREQFPSKYKLTPFMEQPPTTILPKQRVNKTKNKGKKANLSPLNLGGAFEDDNVEENNVTFLGSQFTGNFLMYENVDPTKVRRGNYVNLPAFLNDPHQIYLDCYMKGYIVPVSFWQQLVPHFCMHDMHRLPYGTPIGWLSGEGHSPPKREFVDEMNATRDIGRVRHF